MFTNEWTDKEWSEFQLMWANKIRRHGIWDIILFAVASFYTRQCSELRFLQCDLHLVSSNGVRVPLLCLQRLQKSYFVNYLWTQKKKKDLGKIVVNCVLGTSFPKQHDRVKKYISLTIFKFWYPWFRWKWKKSRLNTTSHDCTQFINKLREKHEMFYTLFSIPILNGTCCVVWTNRNA